MNAIDKCSLLTTEFGDGQVTIALGRMVQRVTVYDSARDAISRRGQRLSTRCDYAKTQTRTLLLVRMA